MAFVRFAHPQADDTIKKGSDISVTAAAIGAEPPADLALEVSEDNGASFAVVVESRLAGRAIHGLYRPTTRQGTIVVFRTRSSTDTTFNSQIQTFVL